MAQKIIIAPAVGDNLLLEISPDTPIAVLRAEVAERLRIAPDGLKVI